MDIVLTKDITPLGKKGDRKSVKNGYFRNFLAPRGLAVRLTPKLLDQINQQRQSIEKRRADMVEKAHEYKEQIEKITLTFERKTTSKDKLYAAITEKQIQEELEKKLKVEMDKEMVRLQVPIKTLGDHEAVIHLTESVSATVKIKVKAL